MNSIKSKRLGIAVIAVLCALIIALTVLIILEATGVLYPDEEVVITPPKRSGSAPVTEGAYTYVALTDGTVMITATNLSADTAEILIPDTLGGCRVSAIGESAFALISGMQTVRIPEGVTYIGSNAFFGALNARLYLPSTVRQIDVNAFAGFDEPAGVYFAGSAEEWNEVRLGDGNTALSRVVFSVK